MDETVTHVNIKVEDLDNYLRSHKQSSTQKVHAAANIKIGEYLTSGYIPTSELISMWQRYGEIPNIPLDQYSLDDLKKLAKADVDVGTITYKDEEYNLSELVNLLDAEEEYQSYEYQQALNSGELIDISYGNKNGKYLFNCGVHQDGTGTYSYVGRYDTTLGILIETDMSNELSQDLDINFNPKLSLKQKISKGLNAFLNYAPKDNVVASGVSYAPDNKNYATASIGTDINSIFTLKANITF